MELHAAPQPPLLVTPVNNPDPKNNDSCSGRENFSLASRCQCGQTLEPAPLSGFEPHTLNLGRPPEHSCDMDSVAENETWPRAGTPPRLPWEDELEPTLLARPGPARPRIRAESSSASIPPPSYRLRTPPLLDDDDDDTTDIPKQPETRPISQEQLIAEVKAIYADLVEVEKQCIEVEQGLIAEPYRWRPQLPQLPQRWDDFIALHRSLLEEHHDLSSRRSSAGSARRRPAPKYCAMPFRLLGQSLFADPAMSERMSRLAFELIPQPSWRVLHIALEALDEVDSELLRWLQKTREIFERLASRFCGYNLFVPVYLFLFCTFFLEFPSGMRHPCTTTPWTIWPALAVLWGVCWMFIQPRHGRADKGISLALGQRPDQHVNPEEWEAYLTYLDMDTVDFSAPDGPNDWPLTLQDCGGIENELATQDGDPASQHPRSVLPVDMPAVLDILDPSLPFHTGVLMSPTTAALGLNTAPLPPHLAPELILNTPLHSPSRGLPASSGVPQLPGTDSDASPGLNRGSSAETRQSQPTRLTSFRCLTCGDYFVRKETLDRHIREQKHGVPSAGPQEPEEHLCPTPGCRKSVRGKGFKRRDKLKEHLAKKSCKPIRQLSKARSRLPSTGPAAVPFASPLQNLEINRADASETQSDDMERSSPEQEGAPTTESRCGNPTIAERVAFLQRWCQADEEELRAVEQEIRAKEEELVARKRVCQQIRERLAASQSSLDMLSKQHQPLLTFSAPDDGQLARDV